jgi:hypothetical protein
MLRRLAPVRADISEEFSTSIIKLTRIGELQTTLVTVNVVSSSSILINLMTEVLNSSETSVITRTILRNISEEGILYTHSREYLKSYIPVILVAEKFLKGVFHNCAFTTRQLETRDDLKDFPLVFRSEKWRCWQKR